MSMRGINWWKERRHTSHSGLPTASRPATAWKEQTLEQAILATFESDAFKTAIAAQLEPSIAKLNQIRTSNLNLESTLQAHIQGQEGHLAKQLEQADHLPAILESIQDQLASFGKQLEELSGAQKRAEDQFPTLFKPIQDHLTSTEEQFVTLSTGQKRVEDRLNDLQSLSTGQQRLESHVKDLFSGQTRLLKSFETRTDGLESRIEEFDRKIDHLDESAVNSDLRSAIRFGELSNELQDRNTTLGDRIWEVQRDLGKKVDGQQRKLLGAYEELGKDIRSLGDTLESMQEDDTKIISRTELMQQNINTIQNKVSSLPSQNEKLSLIEGKISELSSELEVSKSLASQESKSSASQLESLVSVVGNIQAQTESLRAMSQSNAEVHATNDDVQAIRARIDELASSHTDDLKGATLSMSRIEGALMALEAEALSKLEALESKTGRIEECVSPLSAQSTKLDSIASDLVQVSDGMKPHQTQLEEMRSTLSEMRSNTQTILSSHGESLQSIHNSVSATTSHDKLASSLTEMQTAIVEEVSCVKRKQDETLGRLVDLNENTAKHTQITMDLSSTVSTKEDITTLRSTVLGTLEKHDSTLEQAGKPIAALSTKMDELATSTLSNIEHLLQSSTRSTADEIHEHFRGLDGNLDDRFSSMTETVHERVQTLPIKDILDEIRSTKSFLSTEIHEELKSSRTSFEATEAKHTEGITSIMGAMTDIREAHRGGEILLQIESWGQKGISKQEAILASVEATQPRIEAIHQSLSDMGQNSSLIQESIHAMDTKSSAALLEIKTVLEDPAMEEAVKAIQLDTQQLKDDPTIPNIKQLLLQNASSMATTYEGVVAIDTKIKTSEDTISATLQEIQAALSRDILDASSSITSSVNDNLAEVKVDLASRTSTSTNVLRAEMKRIDLAHTLTALDSLKDDIQSTSNMAHEDAERLSTDIRSCVEASQTALAGIVTDLGAENREKFQETAAIMSRLEELSIANTSALPKDPASLERAILSIFETKEEVKMIATAVQGVNHISKANATNLSSIRDLVKQNGGQLSTVSSELKAILKDQREETLQAVKTNSSTLANLEASSHELPKIREDIKRLDSAMGKSSKEIESLILASTTSTSAEVLSVKSGIEGVMSSLTEAGHDRDDAEKTQAAILSAVKHSSTELHEIERTIRDSDEQRRESLELMKQELFKSAETSTGTIDRSLGALNEAIKRGMSEVLDHLKGVAERVAKAQDETVTALKSEAEEVRDAIASGDKKTHSAIESSLSGVKSSLLSEIKNTKDALDAELEGTQSLIQAVKEALELMSNDAQGARDATATESLKSHQATLAAIKSAGESVIEKTARDVLGVKEAVGNLKGDILSRVEALQTTTSLNIADAEKSLQGSMDRLSGNLTTGFSDALAERTQSRKTLDANFNGMIKTIRHGVETTQTAVDSSSNRMLSELETANLTVKSSLDEIKSDLGSVSKYIQTTNASIMGEIGSLNAKTVHGFSDVSASIGQTNTAWARAIENCEISLQSSLETVSGSMKAVDAAVRVNSAAIARVDKAVLETGSQVKGVVLDGNRDVLFQLDEELHENGTRIRGISEFDIPRLEALGKRNRDALEVIGARVLGTAKKFDEMVTYHAKNSSDHHDLLNGRRRGESSASSSVVLS